ncbi:MAG: hypothetical protein KAR40_14675 [Candidatus Sabulitectum sp.]|nr:hypothetical protein [Candidatus Sabulitectum sp.]
MLAKIFTTDSELGKESFVLFPEQRNTLLEIEGKISQLLKLSDFIPVRVAFATYAANYLNQVPLWVMIVAPPSSGKTEILGCLYKLPQAQVISDLTKGSLLSGTSQKEKAKNATGGLLKLLGKFGFLIFKDMTSLLSKQKDAAAELFAALREIADGDFVRFFGNDGGTHKEWAGRMGVIAAVTPEIEKHRASFSSMGDRFLTVRVYNDSNLRMAQAQKALRSSGNELRIRKESQELTENLFQDFQQDMVLPKERFEFILDYIAPLSAFIASCRTPVERSGYSRNIEFIHTTEGYPRLAKQLYGLFCGCITIGCSLQESWEITLRVAMDTIPEQRAQVLEAVLQYEKDTGKCVFTLEKLRAVTRLPKRTNERIVDDLYSVGVLDRDKGTGKSPYVFWFSDMMRENIESFSLTPVEPSCFPEILDDPIPTNGNVEYRGNSNEETESFSREEAENAA